MSLSKLLLRYSLLVSLMMILVISVTIVIGQTRPESWQVLFARQDAPNGDWTVYNLDVERGIYHRMYGDTTFDRLPQVSPDRRFVVWQDRRGILTLYDAETRLSEEIAYGDTPSWSPTSRQLAYPYNGYIRVVTLYDDGTFDDPQVIVNNRRNDVWSPRWSPNGESLVFSIYQEALRQVYIIDANGENLRDLIDGRATDYSPAWSPNGQYIAYASLGGGERNVYLTDATGDTSQLLTGDLSNEYINDLRWSSDNEHLSFISSRVGQSPQVFIIDTLGNTSNAYPTIPISTTHWSPDGSQVAFITPIDAHGAEVGVMVVDAESGDSDTLILTHGTLVILP